MYTGPLITTLQIIITRKSPRCRNLLNAIYSRMGREQSCQRSLLQCNHDKPLGGNVDACLEPPSENLINFIELRLDHSPFHSFNCRRTSFCVISGIQKPDRYSFSSTVKRCWRFSSLLLGGRPFLRSSCSCLTSASPRWSHLRSKY